jgi:hypothetical protein
MYVRVRCVSVRACRMCDNLRPQLRPQHAVTIIYSHSRGGAGDLFDPHLALLLKSSGLTHFEVEAASTRLAGTRFASALDAATVTSPPACVALGRAPVPVLVTRARKSQRKSDEREYWEQHAEEVCGAVHQQ